MDLKKRGVILVSLFAVSTIVFASGSAPSLTNWSAPVTYTPAGRHIMAGEIGGGPFPFFPITPCRQSNSSGTPLTSGVDRTITLTGAPCGIPSGTLAVSVNITIFNISGAGGNGVVKIGTAAAPTTAWINYPSTETQRANAGAVPLNASGQIILQIAQGGGTADIIVDVNGYYYNGSGGVVMPANDYFGIIGVRNGGGVIYAENDSASSANAFSVNTFNMSTGNGSAGVNGLSVAATGKTYGVLGTTGSSDPDSAGVKGIGTGGSFTTGTSFGGYGVHGISNNVSGLGVWGEATNRGVQGCRDTVASGVGTLVTCGVLGYSGNSGVHSFSDITAGGTKFFVVPHPTDPSKQISYISLEGNEAGTYFRGKGQFHKGVAVIEIPENFQLVTEPEGLSVQITPIGEMASYAVTQIDLNHIVAKASKDVSFFYMVNGVRKNYANFDPIGPNVHFAPSSPSDRLVEWPAQTIKTLRENGVLTPEGNVNMETAERLGWTRAWAESEQKLRAEQAAARATRPSPRN